MEMEMEMETKGDKLMQGEGVSKRDRKKQTKGGFRRAYLRLDLYLYGYLECRLEVPTSAYELGTKVKIWLKRRLPRYSFKRHQMGGTWNSALAGNFNGRSRDCLACS